MVDVPYVYALIELAEGPLFGTAIVGCAPTVVRHGMEVEIVYEDVTPGAGETFRSLHSPEIPARRFARLRMITLS